MWPRRKCKWKTSNFSANKLARRQGYGSRQQQRRERTWKRQRSKQKLKPRLCRSLLKLEISKVKRLRRVKLKQELQGILNKKMDLEQNRRKKPKKLKSNLLWILKLTPQPGRSPSRRILQIFTPLLQMILKFRVWVSIQNIWYIKTQISTQHRWSTHLTTRRPIQFSALKNKRPSETWPELSPIRTSSWSSWYITVTKNSRVKSNRWLIPGSFKARSTKGRASTRIKEAAME